MKINAVDDFVEHKLAPENRPVVAMIRELMRECAPQAEEVIAYGIPMWRGNRMLAVISPTKKEITFAFSKGAAFKDRYGLLRGVGKVSKHVKIKSVAEANKDALRYYIKQALKLDRGK